MFVDDNAYAKVFDRDRIKQAIAAGIDAIFVILGESALDRHHDPISWDKLFKMVISHVNKILGLIVDTCEMTIETPEEFRAKVEKLVLDTWHLGCQGFFIKETETLTGQLEHSRNSAPWLKHLMSHIYTLTAYTLKSNRSYLICTNKHLRE